MTEQKCPYCGCDQLTFEATQPGLNCPACNNRVIVRNGSLYTIEQAKNISDQISDSPKPVELGQFTNKSSSCNSPINQNVTAKKLNMLEWLIITIVGFIVFLVIIGIMGSTLPDTSQDYSYPSTSTLSENEENASITDTAEGEEIEGRSWKDREGMENAAKDFEREYKKYEEGDIKADPSSKEAFLKEFEGR